MAEQSFNEAERYLLERWETAVEVEDSVEEVREKYQQLFNQIAERVRGSEKGLTVHFANAINVSSTGEIGIGRESWPKAGKNYPTAFWVENLRLEVLIDDEEEQPAIGFWMYWDDDEDNPYETAWKAILESANKEFSSDDMATWTLGKPDEDEAVIRKQIASKQEILGMLSQGKAKEFVDLIVGQFEDLLRLLPEIDRALVEAQKKAKAL